jgi:hypothetical protein
MASSDESDKLENVNSEETTDHDEMIDSSSDNLNKQPLTNEHLDNNHDDENNHQNGINENDADDDNLGEAPAKFSLDSKFLKDETSESSFDFKVNGSVPNVIFICKFLIFKETFFQFENVYFKIPSQIVCFGLLLNLVMNKHRKKQ